MKARKVKGLDPDGTLAENASRIVLVRLGELQGFATDALDPDQEKALHDMRIAAKRLRYVLEITAPCFGPAAGRGAKTAKALQSLLGDIHDCDVMLPRVRRHRKRLTASDAAAIRAASDGAEDLPAEAARRAPSRSSYRGLGSLEVYLRARRHVLHTRFREEWAELERKGLWSRLEREVRKAPTAEPEPSRPARAVAAAG